MGVSMAWMRSQRTWVRWPRQDLKADDLDGRPIILIHPNGPGGELISRRGIILIQNHPDELGTHEVQVVVTLEVIAWDRRIDYDHIWLGEDTVRMIYGGQTEAGFHLILKSDRPPEGFVPIKRRDASHLPPE